MLSLAALLAAFVAAGCGDKTVTEAPPTVTTQTSPEKHDSESGNNAPAASTLGIQENPNGTNPGMGSR
jgi:hypothetical protein